MIHMTNKNSNPMDDRTTNIFLGAVFFFLVFFAICSYVSKTIEIYKINNNPNTSIVKLNIEKTRIGFIKEGYETKIRTENVLTLITKEGYYMFNEKDSFWFDKDNSFLINNLYLCKSKTLTRDCLVRHKNNLPKEH